MEELIFRAITGMLAIPNVYDASARSVVLRCVIYARYSSETQRKTSIEDQIRLCRAAAERNGWTVLDNYIRSDSELTGRTLVGREGLRELIRLAKTKPLPFDVILIDDTSRFGRYLPDVLREGDILKHYGVTLYFVSDHLDSRDEHFRFAYIIKGIGDEEYVRGLSKKVHRGQEGCILRGQAAGGSCYGYRSEPILDPNQSAKAATARILGAIRKIIDEKAAIIRRVYGTPGGRQWLRNYLENPECHVEVYKASLQRYPRGAEPITHCKIPHLGKYAPQLHGTSSENARRRSTYRTRRNVTILAPFLRNRTERNFASVKLQS
jgi:DNA invertase Pin-like site-specific DNA recombinase